MEIVFATGNKDKVNQIKLMLDNLILKIPEDFGLNDFEVVEDGDSLKENSYKKAKALNDILDKPTIADDTGLFVRSINNRPGVKSHRYAGEDASYKDNRDKLLNELSDKDDRYAYFETCICYIDEEKNTYYFEGKLEGSITLAEIGEFEFGYDQIFMPKGLNKTLGQMTKYEINEISHRAKAFNKFKEYIRENYDENISYK
jgi:non-canonical purine NTP pyrophosphatase, rdgB/HAM1 family